MSIKIEGVGSKENVFSDSDSGTPLWNGTPLLNLVYPVGSIYWSSNNTNPGTLFGGTWTQIKDRFILAAGASYTNGAAGGAATVTLTVSNMPSHSHSFTPSGTVGSHAHSFTPSGSVSSTFTGTAVTSGANNRGHTHNFEHKHTTGNQSANPTFSGSHAHSHTCLTGSRYLTYHYGGQEKGIAGERYIADHQTVHNETGYITTDEKTVTISGTTSGNHTHTTNSLINTSGTAITNTGAESQNHTHSVTASGTVSSSFTGTAGTTSATTPSFTGTAGTTGANGSGTSFSILPPYVVKYCWERTA